MRPTWPGHANARPGLIRLLTLMISSARSALPGCRAAVPVYARGPHPSDKELGEFVEQNAAPRARSQGRRPRNLGRSRSMVSGRLHQIPHGGGDHPVRQVRY
jgi:hypothetical protein